MNFEELIKKLSPTLKRITYKLNGHYSFFNHEDLYQEALIHLWDDFSAGKLSDKTDSYILQGCFFHLKNFIRKVRSKEHLISLDAIISDEESLVLKDNLLDNRYGGRFVKDYLSDKLLIETIRNNGFSKREKDVLGFYGDGMTTREIGQRLGVSHVMVIKIMHKIKEKSRKYSDSL